ncbi:MAG TPA: DUF1015 family protein [Spirochaetota bacterium]|nr:DUF1015 family protein [Spirochaetota bacterium]HPP48968.1 DUF1015 family protein [Spirochaetota bacterium]
MAIIKEFTALCPNQELVSKVAELPYDVVTTEEARSLAQGNPYSFFHITRPEVDLPANNNPYTNEVYRKGKENLQQFINSGVLLYDDAAYLYLYTLTMQNHQQTGIVAGVSIDDYINGIVKKHELTREDKEIDRMNHINIVGAQTGLVYLFYKNNDALQELMKESILSPVLYDFVAADGVQHTVRKIKDNLLAAKIKDALQPLVLYIADGHHRAASAVRVGLERRKSGFSGGEAFNYFVATIFPHSELQILPYNRVVKDLNNHDLRSFMNELSQSFLVEKSDSGIVAKPHEIRMYCDGQWYVLHYKKELPLNDVERLDVAILQNVILAPILGIQDPRRDSRIDFIGGVNAVNDLIALVNSGKFKIGFSLYPTSINELIAISDKGGIMPPKSTWFEPKLRDGLLVHVIG